MSVDSFLTVIQFTSSFMFDLVKQMRTFRRKIVFFEAEIHFSEITWKLIHHWIRLKFLYILCFRIYEPERLYSTETNWELTEYPVIKSISWPIKTLHNVGFDKPWNSFPKFAWNVASKPTYTLFKKWVMMETVPISSSHSLYAV